MTRRRWAALSVLAIGCSSGGPFGLQESVTVTVTHQASSPADGPLAGGTLVDLTATITPHNNCFVVCDNFGIDSVWVGGAVARFTVAQGTTATSSIIQLTTPARDSAGTVNIVVKASNNAGTSGTATCANCFTYDAAS